MSKKKTKDEIEHDLLLSHYKDVLKTTAGKEVIWDILGNCNLYEILYDGDANIMCINEGKRSVGLALLERLSEASPTLYANLQLEKAKQEEGRDE